MTERHDAPCHAPAGSQERIECYRARVEAGQPIWNPGDTPKMVQQRNEPPQPPKKPAVREINLREIFRG